MKLATANKATVASQGVKGSSGFSIATSAHMFNILSDGLYSDKVAAVLREIGCNANDAHIMAGKPDLPFEVKLPTRLDPAFHIKDFGPGLDDHEVRELYTTYGWSSKQNSNEVTGAFGLGSKSPFAYTDLFSICAVKNGVKRVYTAHKDDEGKPVVSLLSESPADDDWQAGVMVTFPVPPEDVSEFVSKAQQVFRWFSVKPTIIGVKLDIETPTFKTRGPGFGLADVALGNTVVMANVAYPLNGSRLDSLPTVSTALLGCGIHLFLPTGAVMPTPNREDLQYDKNSKPRLAAALHEAAREVAKEIYARVNADKAQPWNWHRKIRQYAVSLPGAVRYRVAQFLELVTTDKAELEQMTRLFEDAAKDMPLWVGDGAMAPVDFAAMRGEVDEDVPAADLKGCRVWRYTFHQPARGSGYTIRRREVIRGHVRFARSQDPSRAAFAYTSDLTVMVADAGRADLRVKHAMCAATHGKDDPTGHEVLLVQPVRGADVAFALAYAQKLAGPSQDGLGGVPVVQASAVDLPTSVIEAAKSARMTLADRREEFLDEELKYFSLTDSNPPAKVVVSELDEATERYFVVHREGPGLFGNATSQYEFEGLRYGDMRDVCAAVAQLRKVEAFEGLPGFVAVSSKQVKQLKLEEDGWKPALPALRQCLSDQRWSKRLGAHVDKTPLLDVSHEYYAKRAGFVGVLAWLEKQGSPVAAQVKKLMPDHPVVLVASRLAATAVAGRASDIEGWITQVNRCFTSIDNSEFRRFSDYELNNVTLQAYPALKFLNFDEWTEACESTPELAASLLWQFVHLAADADPAQLARLQKLAA